MHPIHRQDLSLSTQPRSSSFGGSTAPTAATAAIFQHSTNQELDDYIIDEILSLEDEQQQLRSTLNCNGTVAEERDTKISSSLTEKLLAMKPMLAPQVQQQRCDIAYSSSGACATTDSRGGSSGNTSYNGSSVTMTSISAAAAISAAGGNGRDHFRQVVSSSAPTSTFDMEAFIRRGSPSGGGSGSGNENELYRDRRKKDIHNMIERRRRYNINDRIKELGLMLPKSTAEEMKLNKGTILKASCDYIKHLQRDRDIMIRQQQRQYQLEETSRRFMDRIKELEEHMEKHGLQVPPSDLPDLSVTVGSPVYSANDSPTRGPSFPFEGRAIKQEPLDMDFEGGVGGALLSPTITTTPTSESQQQQQWGSGYMSHQLQEMQIAGSPQSRGSSSRAAMQNALLQQKSPHLSINSSHLLASSLPNNGFAGGMPGQFSPSGMKTETIGSGGGGQHHVLWSPGGNSMQQQSQQMQQMNGFFGDAMAIDDIISNNQGPLLQGDPMMGSLTHNQMSPDIQWDMANFSPETTHSGGSGTRNCAATTMSPNSCQRQQQMASQQNNQFPRS